MAVCPECESTVDIDEGDVEIGDELSCAECGSVLRVASESPIELEAVDEDDEDEDEDEGDEDEDEDEEEGDEREDDDPWSDKNE